MPFRKSVRSGICPFGQASIQTNVHSGKCFSVKCPFGQIYLLTSVHSE